MQESSSIHATNSIGTTKQQHLHTHLDATGNKEATVRQKISKKETMSDGDGKVVGEGGDILAGMECVPLLVVIDVSSLSKK